MKRYIFILISLFGPLLLNASVTDFETENNTVPKIDSIAKHDNITNYQVPTPAKTTFNFKDTPEWQKFKIMRAVGWSCFGCGLGIGAFGGLLAMTVAIEKGDFVGPPLICTVVGGSLVLASVPILAIGYHYKNKAKKMAFEMSMTQLYTPQIGHTCPYTPGIGLTLKF